MKQKKTLKLWQMIIVNLLLVMLVVTMFVPAIRIDGKALKKAIPVSDELIQLIGGGTTDEYENIEGSFDNYIKEYEQKTNTKIAKISPFRIMTHSAEKLILGNGEDNLMAQEESYQGEQDEQIKDLINNYVRKPYNTLRILLWVIYISALVLILMTLLAFFLKWNKVVPLIISIVYGIAAAIIFGYLRFGFVRSLAKKLSGALQELSPEISALAEAFSSSVAKVLACFLSIAFLLAFVIAILIIIVNVIFIFIGNGRDSSAGSENWEEDTEYGNDEKGYGSFYDSAVAEKVSAVQTVSVEPAQQSIPKQQVVPAQPVGQVKCTKGLSAGQGFSLPQDRKVIVGKSPQNANLVINYQHISNIHCSIRYNAMANMYVIKDHSTNGTFVNGNRLPKEVSLEYPAGTVLTLADGKNEITLG